MGDHLESRVFDIRKTDGRAQSCAEYRLSKVKHKCNEIYNQNYNKVSAKLKRANQAVLEAQSEAIEAERQDLERRLKEINDR